MQHVELSRLAQDAPLRVLLVNAGEPDSLTWSGLAQPLRLAARLLGPQRVHVDVLRADQFTGEFAGNLGSLWHLVLLVADEAEAALRPPGMGQLPHSAGRSLLTRARRITGAGVRRLGPPGPRAAALSHYTSGLWQNPRRRCRSASA